MPELIYKQELLNINPSDHILQVVDVNKYKYDLGVVVEYFNNHQFVLALNHLNRSDIDVDLRVFLNSLILFYHYFDHFQYDNNYDFHVNDYVIVKNDIISKNIDSIKYLVGDDFSSACYSIANLVNNARRRFDEENYDDAISRLYKAVELISAEKLKDYGISTLNNKIEVFKKNNLPLNLVKSVHSYIPVNTQYKILKLLNDPIGLTYSIYAKKGVNIIYQRNNSNINHGSYSVSREHYEELEESVITLAKQLAYDIEDLIVRTRFPRLTLKNSKYIIIN